MDMQDVNNLNLCNPIIALLAQLALGIATAVTAVLDLAEIVLALSQGKRIPTW